MMSPYLAVRELRAHLARPGMLFGLPFFFFLLNSTSFFLLLNVEGLLIKSGRLELRLMLIMLEVSLFTEENEGKRSACMAHVQSSRIFGI